MSTNEILTLQFGHYPNFIGAHWWNIQEAGFQYSPNPESPTEINHDVLFREGFTSKGDVTFTPRLLLVDLKGSLKTLAKHGDLYDPINEPDLLSIPWNESAIEVKYDEKPAKNELQEAISKQIIKVDNIKSSDLENSVEVWSDFLYTRYHPRTVNIVNEYQHNNTDNPFDVFNLGSDVWKSDFEDEFTDKIRVYIEECDSLQGFQILLDATNAFGGLSASCLEHLKDEYDKKAVLSIPILPSYHSDYKFNNSEDRERSTLKDSVRLVNLLLSLDTISENSCLTVPLCTGTKGWRQPGPKRDFRHLKYNQESFYHTSAILATAIDTFTLPYRLKTSNFTIGDFCADLNSHGRKIAAASLGLPFGLKAGEDFIDCLDKFEGSLWETLTPNCKIDLDKTLQHVTLRGIPVDRLKKPVHLAKKQREMQAYRCGSVHEMFDCYLQCSSFCSVSHATVVNSPLNISVPYPDIFKDVVDVRGNISDVSRTAEQSVKSIPVVSGCHSGSYVGNTLEVLHRESGRIKISKLHQFKTCGLEEDEYKECLNRLLDLRDCYEETFE